VGDIEIFEVIFVAENSNKFQKTKFWKEKSVENLVTPFNSSTISFHIWQFKKIATYIIAKQCSHVEFPYLFCNGFTLGPTVFDNRSFEGCLMLCSPIGWLDVGYIISHNLCAPMCSPYTRNSNNLTVTCGSLNL
jgi:hypothetical protein